MPTWVKHNWGKFICIASETVPSADRPIRYLPALHVQDPSTGEQVAPFSQVQTEEQLTPYVPAGHFTAQSVS